MINNKGKTILVTGATGNQGGAVAHILLAGGWSVRALVRDPSKPAALALAEKGVQVVTGDLDDQASVVQALKGVYGVFGVQTFMEQGTAGEIRQGKTLADITKVAGIRHFVYSSVAGAERNSGIPHFESKWEIEQYIRALKLPATIFRPVFFMYNFNSPLFNLRQSIQEGTLSLAIRTDKSMQMLAVEDLGAFVTMAFEKPSDFIGKAIELAGDEMTMSQAVEVFSRVMGRPVRFVEMTIGQVRSFSEDLALMFKWINEKGFRADISSLRALHPQLMTLETWLRKTGWGKT
ncbi:NAD(P)H azoreductase [Candidatus Brocadiaceae bacterium B188]|nr:NmrA/HSCARG family protein [Candidatus Brocadia sapporoensis]QQR65636.1 MAG: NmrA/HSCARG family protein [Candidatus Brocadia sp.]RZV59863.1 MAG: NmrA/HSCARG family protein [Candidatus Brocadia sp. BROELEC01]TWU49941.1 NAD(P)H azoreductase [Candidatus Brocadiaceae bacterium B188]